MTRPMDVPVFSGEPLWHTLAMSQALEAAGVEAQQGLSSAEAAVRAERFGPNKFAEAKAEPRWRAFLRQYADLMQIVLLAAGFQPRNRRLSAHTDVLVASAIVKQASACGLRAPRSRTVMVTGDNR